MTSDTALVIDDLVAPNLSALQGQILDHVDERPVDLDPDTLVAEAETRTGLNDFGAGEFRQRMETNIAAIDYCGHRLRHAGSTNLNRIILRNRKFGQLPQHSHAGMRHHTMTVRRH